MRVLHQQRLGVAEERTAQVAGQVEVEFTNIPSLDVPDQQFVATPPLVPDE